LGQGLEKAVGDILGQIAGTGPAHASAGISRRAGHRISEQASKYEVMVAQYASANGVPATLVHRVILRESRYNARAVHSGNYGLMQIRLGTARALGYSGSAEGLLDPDTNMSYAVRYLAGAYRAARGNEDRAVALYARGY
jgi:soluble lytic murein transglycosylase-like protein